MSKTTSCVGQRVRKLLLPSHQVAPETLGPLHVLRGTWKTDNTGWNMIALPLASASTKYRVLMNQYSETLTFGTVDDDVPNRGVESVSSDVQTDQFIAALDYEQSINQVRHAESPTSGDAAPDGAAIHHEPGLWLFMHNQETEGFNLARMGTIPHGDSVLALGKFDNSVDVINGAPTIPNLNGFPLNAPGGAYLAPYDNFEKNHFKGTEQDNAAFPGFFASNANAILQFALGTFQDRVVRTTVLSVDTEPKASGGEAFLVEGKRSAGILNIPFVIKQADATSMQSTFWVMELDDGSHQLMYSQMIMLDFFTGTDGETKIRWPHISIATLTKQ